MRWLTFDSLDEGVDDTASAAAAIRPSPTPILVLSLALWAACATSYFLLGSAAQEAALAVMSAGGVLALGCALWLWRSGGRLAAAVGLGIALGLCLGGAGAYTMHVRMAHLADEAAYWEFQLVEDASAGAYGSSANAQGVSESGERMNVRLNFDEEVDLLHGARIKAYVALKEPSEQSASYYWSQGLCASMSISTYEPVPDEGIAAPLRQVRKLAIEQLGHYGGGQAGILQALSCGYRNTIEETGDYDSYKITGLAHIVAVSGAHLSLVTSMFGLLLRALRLPRFAVMGTSALFVVAYLVLAGVPLSAVRAAAMVLLAFGGQVSRRRTASLNALGLCVIAFIMLDPAVSMSVSLFLSAGSTLGIILFARLISSWLAALPRGVRRAVGEPASLTLASNVMTLPFSAALFSQISLIAPVANVIAMPLFTLGCVAGLAASLISCFVPGLAALAVSIASVCAMPLEIAVDAMAHIPHACIAVSLPVVPMLALSAALCGCLWVTWPHLKPRVLAAGVALSLVVASAVIVVSPLLHPDEIIMLDVGQGDAFLVRSEGACVLIDTGNQDAKLRAELGRFGVYALDAVLISHADDDHCASLSALRGIVDVQSVYAPDDALDCTCASCADLRSAARTVLGTQGAGDEMEASGTEVSKSEMAKNSFASGGSTHGGGLGGLEVGDEICVGKFTLHVVWPHEFVDEGGNADSLCLLAELDDDGDGTCDWSALFCGDAEADQIKQIVDAGDLGEIDVLKVGHHGARVALSDELVQTLCPQVALISVGANNRYGHPSEETLERLSQTGARVLRTDTDGSARLSFDGDAMRVSFGGSSTTFG